MRAIGVSHTACKDEFRRNLRFHSWSVFSFFLIYFLKRSIQLSIHILPGKIVTGIQVTLNYGIWKTGALLIGHRVSDKKVLVVVKKHAGCSTPYCKVVCVEYVSQILRKIVCGYDFTRCCLSRLGWTLKVALNLAND